MIPQLAVQAVCIQSSETDVRGNVVDAATIPVKVKGRSLAEVIAAIVVVVVVVVVVVLTLVQLLHFNAFCPRSLLHPSS